MVKVHLKVVGWELIFSSCFSKKITADTVFVIDILSSKMLVDCLLVCSKHSGESRRGMQMQVIRR